VVPFDPPRLQPIACRIERAFHWQARSGSTSRRIYASLSNWCVIRSKHLKGPWNRDDPQEALGNIYVMGIRRRRCLFAELRRFKPTGGSRTDADRIQRDRQLVAAHAAHDGGRNQAVSLTESACWTCRKIHDRCRIFPPPHPPPWPAISACVQHRKGYLIAVGVTPRWRTRRRRLSQPDHGTQAGTDGGSAGTGHAVTRAKRRCPCCGRWDHRARLREKNCTAFCGLHIPGCVHSGQANPCAEDVKQSEAGGEGGEDHNVYPCAFYEGLVQ